jgi:putative ABC transport system ATP-binding protein
MQSDNVAQLIGASKEYKTGDQVITALYPTDFTLKKGELTLIIGPSGSGKTTLLSLLGCVHLPNSGAGCGWWTSGQFVFRKTARLSAPEQYRVHVFRTSISFSRSQRKKM